jgi:predicted transcriptional regulator
MDTEYLLRTLRSLEDRHAVTLGRLSHEVGADAATVQTALDGLLGTGEVCKSELRVRKNEGYDFRLREVWYHTPQREVTARFGDIVATHGIHARTPQPDAQAPVSLAS